MRYDGTTFQTLQESLSRMSRECDDELTMQCITELIMTPNKPAEYIAAGRFEEIDWAHVALLTSPTTRTFTSPIRRYQNKNRGVHRTANSSDTRKRTN